jgi:hypothetical protein
MESTTPEQPEASTKLASLSEDTRSTSAPRDSAALRRLMDEVRCEETYGSSVAGSYDRAHNRHNR